MSKKVLITYASKTGSTKEVAEFISEKLINSGFETLVMNVNKVKNVKLFDAVILGTPLRLEKPLHESISFAQKYSRDLKNVPLAFFALGVSMKDQTDEGKQKSLELLNPLLSKIPEPFEIGLFGGKVDHKKLPWVWRFLAKKDDSGLMVEGDWRNWAEIESWVENIKNYEPLNN